MGFLPFETFHEKVNMYLFMNAEQRLWMTNYMQNIIVQSHQFSREVRQTSEAAHPINQFAQIDNLSLWVNSRHK